eukprot:PITA_09834
MAAKAWLGGMVTAVDAQGASGGLAILWDARAIQLINIPANKNFIQAIFHIIGTSIHGHMINVYFPQETAHKAEILDTLSELNSTRMHPLWISGGDFNMISRLEEKQGGRNRGNRDGNILKDFIQDNRLIDIPSNNGMFTWNNKREGSQQIASRLDIFLLFDNAIHLGGEFTASILSISGSDHWPIELQWSRPGSRTSRPFRFEAFWMTHMDFNDLVSSKWHNFIPSNGSKMYPFQQKLRYLKSKIKYWNHTSFSNISQAQNALNQEMKKVQQRIINEGRSKDLTNQEQTLEAQILTRAIQEETLWRQKSRVKWLKDGEKNTKFFHKTTVVLRKIPKLIAEEHNLLLLCPTDLQEVENVVRQLKAGKAPGSDGFTSNFFHNFWDLIKLELWQVVEELRTLCWMYPGLNATFIALIPKEEESNTLDKYRPITLYNIIYKIVSKIIATRLKLLLPLIILPEQSGYAEGRQITDGIILTHEIIHSLRQSKKPGMLLKIDLSKAFDSLSCVYIQKVLNAFGFDPASIRWVFSLLSSFFSVLINGIPSPTFRPSRGIRQGDPFSPFLFVIMADGLGRSIKSALHSQ